MSPDFRQPIFNAKSWPAEQPQAAVGAGWLVNFTRRSGRILRWWIGSLLHRPTLHHLTEMQLAGPWHSSVVISTKRG